MKTSHCKSQCKESIRFIARVTVIHILTYIVSGIIFSNLFDYQTLFTLGNAKYFMRDMSSLSTVIGPAVQVFRGILFGLIILLFRDSIMRKPFAWLRLWGVIAVLGIINTPGPSPFSIEGLVYTQLPLEFHIKGAPEILFQTLLFSVLITRQKVENKKRLPQRIKEAFAAMIIAGVGFSVSGILLALVLGADIMAGTNDLGAFVIMFLAMAIVFAATRYLDITLTMRKILYYIICYATLAGLPTLYNFLTNSQFKSILSLIISGLPVVIIAFYRESKWFSKEE